MKKVNFFLSAFVISDKELAFPAFHCNIVKPKHLVWDTAEGMESLPFFSPLTGLSGHPDR